MILLRCHTPTTVTLHGVTYCGDRGCAGQCGLPAGYIEHLGAQYRLRSCMTARGPVMQPMCDEHPNSVDLRTVCTAAEIRWLLLAWWT